MDSLANATLNQAIGMMVALCRVTADKGRSVVDEVARHTRLKPARVAELVVYWAQPGAIRAELEDALDRHAPLADPRHHPTRIPIASPCPSGSDTDAWRLRPGTLGPSESTPGQAGPNRTMPAKVEGMAAAKDRCPATATPARGGTRPPPA